MRRKDRALSREEAYEVMDAVSYAVLKFTMKEITAKGKTTVKLPVE